MVPLDYYDTAICIFLGLRLMRYSNLRFLWRHWDNVIQQLVSV